jgi:hypothetical protein
MDRPLSKQISLDLGWDYMHNNLTLLAEGRTHEAS